MKFIRIFLMASFFFLFLGVGNYNASAEHQHCGPPLTTEAIEKCEAEHGVDSLTLQAPFQKGKETIDTSGDAISILGQYVEQIFSFGMALIVIFAVLMIMVAGYEYMFAGGDSGKTDNAKKRIMQALLGVVLVLLAALLLNIINPNFFKFA